MAWSKTRAGLARLSLRTRIFVILAALVLTNAAGALATLWYIHRTQGLDVTLAQGGDRASTRAALVLCSALSRQAGFSASGLKPSDPSWNIRLEDLTGQTERRLAHARELLSSEEARPLLNRVEAEQVRFVALASQAVEAGIGGREAESQALFAEAGTRAVQALTACEQYADVHDRLLTARDLEATRRSQVVAALSWAAILLTVGMGLVLGFILIRQVLLPIRRLAVGPETTEGFREVGDEVQALSSRVQHLLTDVDKAKSKLAESREHLIASEKMALTGKLAAGVAHSIRNPLTSVKMRLFSLQRALELAPQEKEDFAVISEEIRHIDAIVRNFLEFSRPPKLKPRRMSPSDVTDMTLQLLRHRLDAYGMEVELVRSRRLPDCELDPDQIKEVMANIILNACEAKVEKGRLVIEEQAGVMDPHGHVALVTITDNGPGIPRVNQERIFQPFFTTKGEGTGLGLPIAKRIMDEHGGWLHCRSEEGKGASFVLGLPCKERTAWLQSS